MRNKAIFCLLVVLLMAIPADSQYGNVYFSLSTNKTFLPGEKINLHLYANGVDALEFRVYKVNDAVRFFERLETCTTSDTSCRRNKSRRERCWNDFTTGSGNCGAPYEIFSVTSTRARYGRRFAKSGEMQRKARK